jgi:hypothetical protein
VRQEKCGKKITVGKVRQKKCSKKIMAGKVWQKKCGRKSTAEKPRQENRGKKSATTECYKKKRYGFHMCSVDLMNQVDGLSCKYVGCPLGSLWIVVELI